MKQSNQQLPPAPIPQSYRRVSSVETNASGNSGLNIGFILVEISDGSSSRIPVTLSTTPLTMMRIIGKKNNLETTHFFGIQAGRSCMVNAINSVGRSPETPAPSLTPTSPLQQSTVAGSNTNEPDQTEDRVFLVDDLPLHEQILINSKTKVYMSLKYNFAEADLEAEVPKTMTLIYHELAGRFKNYPDILPRQPLVSMISCVIHCNTIQRIGGDSITEDVKNVTPKGCLQFLQDDSFYEHAREATKQLSDATLENAALKFLKLFWQNCQPAFQHRFELIHPEFSIPLAVSVGSHGMTIKFDQGSSTFIPYRRMKNWKLGIIDGDSIIVKQCKSENDLASREATAASVRNLLKQGITGEERSVNGQVAMLAREKEELYKNVMNLSYACLGGSNAAHIDKSANSSSLSLISSTPILESWVKRANTIRKPNPNSSKRPGLPIKDRLYRYIFTIELQEEYLNDIELALISLYPNDYQMIELMNFYNNRVNDAEQALKRPDSSNFPPGSQIALAKVDYVAKTQDELMFLAGDEILILKKLDNGKYLGECQGLQGVFDGSKVTILMNNKREAIAPSSSSRLPAVAAKDNGMGPGYILNIHLLDDTKRSIIVSPHINGAMLRKQAIEKLELIDADFFDLVDIANGEHRWIRPDIMLLSQGINQSSKVLLKARVLYYDVSELSSPTSVYLYYLQIKQMILSGDVAGLTESDVVDLASLQLQATFGDYDQDSQNGTFLQSSSALQRYLPPPFCKMTLSKNESYWSKRIYAAYQQHKGLTKKEAEKAYIASSQRFPIFGYQLHNLVNPENLMLGVGRDGFLLFDKASKSVTEKHVISDIMYSSKNVGFTAQLLFEENGTERFTRLFTLDALDIIESFWLLSVAESKSKQRRRCRFIREKFSALNLSLEPTTDNQNLRFLKDPERLSLALKNGYALNILLDALKQPLLFKQDAEPLAINEESIYNDVGESLRIKNIKNFISSSTKTYGMAATDLFRPEDVWPYNLSSFHRVTEFLFQLLNLPAVVEVSQQLFDILKKRKRTKNDANGIASTEMTEDDLLGKVLQELLATEKNYVADLEKIVEKYVVPLKHRIAAGDPSDTVLLDMFGNVKDLLHFHQQFLNVLEVFGCDIERIGDIGLLFLEKGDEFVPLYNRYCLNHVEPSERLPADLKLSAESMAIIGFTGDPQVDQMAKHHLSAQIIKPVQRIMRYHLLLKELLRYAAKDDVGYRNLEEGLNKMKNVASKINEIKRLKENATLAQSLRENLEGYEGPPFEMLGQLLVHGRLMMVEKGLPSGPSKKPLTTKSLVVNVFLFEEAMLCCTESKRKTGGSSNQYKMKLILLPIHVDVREEVTDTGLIEDIKNSWEVSRKDGQKSFIFSASGSEERERWVSTLMERCGQAVGKKSPVHEYQENAAAQRKSEDSGMRLSAFGTIRKLGKKKDHDAVSPYSTSASNESTTEPLPRSTNLSRSQSNTGTLENISNQPQAASKQTPETAALTIQISNLMQTVEELQQNNRILTAENIQLSQKLRVEQDKTKHLERELAKYRPNPSITSTSISPQQKPVTSAGYTATVNRSTTSTSISEQQQQQKPPSFRSNSPAAVPKYHSASLRDQLSSQMSELESLLLSMSNASLNGETK